MLLTVVVAAMAAVANALRRHRLVVVAANI
jgi:hypothetical protein